MDRDTPENTTSITKSSADRAWEVLLKSSFLWKSSSNNRLVQALVLLNLFLLFSRLPDSISIISKSFLSVAIAFSCFALSLPRYGTLINYHTKVLLGFLVFNAANIFFGKVIYDDWIINDGQAFARWTSMTQEFLCFLMPVAVFSRFGLGWRKLQSVLVFIGIYLGLYTLTHGGSGPGGFVKDENDCGLVLVMMFPFAIMGFIEKNKLLYRAFCGISCIVICGGIVATQSRGTFVGFIVTSLLIFWKSPNKGLLLGAAILASVTAVPFIPDSYWKEVKSIKTEAQKDTGTTRERLESWKIGINMWLSPENFIQGVGIANGPWALRYYEPDERYRTGRSIAGRQFHSMHIELIGDFGLLGIIFLYGLMYISYRRNTQIVYQAKLMILKNRDLQLELNNNSYSGSSSSTSDSNSTEDRLLTCANIEKSLISWSSFARQINLSMTAILAAGSFISVLYYPPIWFILFMSAALDKSWKDIERVFQEHEDLNPSIGSDITLNPDKQRMQFINRVLDAPN